MQAPVVVMSRVFRYSTRFMAVVSNVDIDTQSGDRQVGRKAQLSNITAAKTYVTLYLPVDSHRH